jgi:hypothetical protein
MIKRILLKHHIYILLGLIIIAVSGCNSKLTKNGPAHSSKLTDDIQTVVINRWKIGIDSQTGSLVGLSHPDIGVIISASEQSIGLIDLAYPVWEFLPLRLASRFSQARIIQEKNQLTIVWDKLGPSRTHFTMPQGRVCARVEILADTDGKSLIFKCKIINDSEKKVLQVLFPDFWGVQPFAGHKNTRISFKQRQAYPFLRFRRQPEQFFYCTGAWMSYEPSQKLKDKLYWMDFGTDKAAVEVYQKGKGWKKQTEGPFLMTQRKQSDDNFLRLCWEHRVIIDPGESWVSDEFLLTPVVKEFSVPALSEKPKP